VGNAGEAVLGAICVRLFKNDHPLFESVHGVIVFLGFGVLLPTLATSFLDAAGVILTGLGQNYWTLWTTRLTSNILADLTIVPTIVRAARMLEVSRVDRGCDSDRTWSELLDPVDDSAYFQHPG